MKKVIVGVGALLAGVAVAVLVTPDLKRYLRIRSM